MRKLAAVFAFLLVLTGCKAGGGDLDRVLTLRATLLQSAGCSFTAVITADYGKQISQFTLDCKADQKGNVTFTVAQPQTISGITGTVSGEGGKLTFDDRVLAFELLADGQLSPVSAPWVFVKTLRGGYITSVGMDGDHLRSAIDDSYADDALQLDIWHGVGDLPIRAEFLWNSRRILSMEIKNFQIL